MGSNLSFPAVDLNGRVAVVTGGNAGIGYETAKALAVMGAHTIIACRSSERAATAVEQIRQEIYTEFPEKCPTIEWMLLDLGSFRSTKDFSTAFQERNLPLHMLINNAGVAMAPLTMTEDGYEIHFQVNHLGHFLLTLELLPLMIDSALSLGDGRIVFVSDADHCKGEFNPGNMNAEQSYARQKFYWHSKLYNVMTAYALQRRLNDVGITISSLHPGMVDTDIILKSVTDSKSMTYFYKAIQFLLKPIFRDAETGAATSVNCAVNPRLNCQRCLYYDSCHIKEPSAISRNEKLQEELWEISVSIVKDFLSPEVLEKYGPRFEVVTFLEEPLANEGEEEEQHVIINDGHRCVSFRASLAKASDDIDFELEEVAEYQGLSELKQNGTAFEGSQMAKYHEHN